MNSSDGGSINHNSYSDIMRMNFIGYRAIGVIDCSNDSIHGAYSGYGDIGEGDCVVN
jgi:hypothetical protein